MSNVEKALPAFSGEGKFYFFSSATQTPKISRTW